MTELQAFIAMLNRCGIPHQDSRTWDRQKDAPGDGTEVELSPERKDQNPDTGETMVMAKPGNHLTGASWASTTLTFDATGALAHIHMEGD